MSAPRYCHLSHAIAGENAEDFNGGYRCRACAGARNILSSNGKPRPSAELFELVADGLFIRYLGWGTTSMVRPGDKYDKWSREAMTIADRELMRKVDARERN